MALIVAINLHVWNYGWSCWVWNTVGYVWKKEGDNDSKCWYLCVWYRGIIFSKYCYLHLPEVVHCSMLHLLLHLRLCLLHGDHWRQVVYLCGDWTRVSLGFGVHEPSSCSMDIPNMVSPPTRRIHTGLNLIYSLGHPRLGTRISTMALGSRTHRPG